MNGWPLVRLGDHLRIKHGFAFQGEYFADKGKYIVLTPGNFIESGGFKPKSGAEKYYTGTPPDEFVLRRGDLVIAMTEQAQGLLGSSALIPAGNTYLHNQRIGLVEQRSGDTDRNFLYYLFNTGGIRDQIQASATGSKVRHTAPTRVESLSVHLPPLVTQRKIAAVLSAYDDFIENNNRRTKLLEEMTQRIYREWFVDYRYPGHEGVPLLDSQLGPIPNGWEVARLGELATLNKGISYQGAFLTDYGLPMANLKCIYPTGGFRRDGTKPYSGPFKHRHEVRPGDVILANTDLKQSGHVIGAPAIVPRKGFERGGLISHHLCVVRPNDNRIGRALLFQSLADVKFRSFARGRASGTTVLGLRTDDCADYPLIVPPLQVSSRFSAVAEATIDEAEALAEANDNLRATRDTLLPRLFSGEIDITDLDIAMPAAAA